MEAFYKTVNAQWKVFKPRTNTCRGNDGNLITNEEEILERWSNHFSSLLRSTQNVALEDNLDRSAHYRECELLDPPDEEEIEGTVQKFRNNQAPECDAIPAHHLETSSGEVTKVIRDLLHSIWLNKTFPDDLYIGLIIPLHKKGDQTNWQISWHKTCKLELQAPPL